MFSSTLGIFSLILIILFSIALLWIIFYFVKDFKKNAPINRSGVRSIFKSKFALSLVIIFYGVSFGVLGGTIVFNQRLENGLNQLAYDNNTQNVSSTFDPNDVIPLNGNNVSAQTFNLIIKPTTDVTTEQSYTFLKTSVYQKVYQGGTLTEAQWWDSAIEAYGSEQTVMAALAFTNFTQDWNANPANKFDISYSMDRYKIWKPLDRGKQNISFEFISLANQDLTNPIDVYGPNYFRNNGTFASNQKILNSVEWYYVAPEDNTGQDGVQRLFSANPPPNVGSSINIPFQIAISQDWYELNQDIIKNNIFAMSGYYFEILATFRLPHYLYPVQDQTTQLVDLKLQPLVLLNQSFYNEIDFTLEDEQAYLYFGYSNVYSKINTSLDYAEKSIENIAQENTKSIFVTDTTLTSSLNLSNTFSYFELSEDLYAARMYVPIIQLSANQGIVNILLIFFLIINIILILILVIKKVKSSLKSIGTLKAMGVRNRDVSISYLFFPSFIIFSGGILAIIFSFLFQGLWLGSFGGLFAISFGSPMFTMFAFIICILMPLLISLTINYLSTVFVLRKPTLDLINNVSNYKPNVLVRTTGVLTRKIKRFSFSYKVKNGFKSFSKSFLLFFAIFASITLTAFSFASSTTTENLVQELSKEFGDVSASPIDTFSYQEFNSYSSTQYPDVKDMLISTGLSAYDFDMDLNFDSKLILDETNLVANYSAIMQPASDYVLNTVIYKTNPTTVNGVVDVDYFIDTQYLLKFYENYTYFQVLEYQTGLDILNNNSTGTSLNQYLPLFQQLIQRSLVNKSIKGKPLEIPTPPLDASDPNEIIEFVNGLIEFIEQDMPQTLTFFDFYYDQENTIPSFDTNFLWQRGSEKDESFVRFFKNPVEIKKIFETLPVSDQTLAKLSDDYFYGTTKVIPFIAQTTQLKNFDKNFTGTKYTDSQSYNQTIYSVDLQEVEGSLPQQNNILIMPIEVYNTRADFGVFSSSDQIDNLFTNNRTEVWNNFNYYDDNLIGDNYTILSPIPQTINTDGFLFNLPGESSAWRSQINFYFSPTTIVSQLNTIYGFLEDFLFIFSALALFIAFVLILISLKDVIDNAKNEVALLKTFGYSNYKSTMLVLSPYLFIIFLGLIFALPLSIAALGALGLLISGSASLPISFALTSTQWITIAMIILALFTVIISYAFFFYKSSSALDMFNKTRD